MVECIFCNIINNKIPCIKVYEDDNFLAFLDIHPINKGHVLLIPKEHCENIFEIESKNILSNYFYVIKNIATAVKKAVGADGVNIAMNNGKAAGQVIMHSHVHIIPRFNDDGLKTWDREIKTDNKELEEIGEKIKKEL